MNAFVSFLMPGGVICAASLIAVHVEAVEANLGIIARVYPVIVLAVSVAYGIRFNRSCLVFGSLCITIAIALLTYVGSIPHPEDLYWRITYVCVALALPVDLMLLGILKERGVFTARGVLRMLAILAQPLAAGMIASRNPAGFAKILEGDIVNLPLAGFLGMPQAAALTGLVCLCAAAAVYAWKPHPKESGFFWAQCLVLAALHAGPDRDAAIFHLSGSALALLLSMVETSHALAYKDELTGLPGRRALREEFLKLGGDYCIAMVDVDHFKKFNDTYGHDAGDDVLRMVASRLMRMGGSARAFRYGGEEFTIVFAGPAADEAADRLEQLRKDIASTAFTIRSALRPKKRPSRVKRPKGDPVQVKVTVSIGAAWRKDGETSPDDVLTRADKALYRAKRTGRNRVVTA